MSTTFQPSDPERKALITVSDVLQRTVNKRDGSSFTIYDITVAEQREPFSTTKRQVAESAYSLKNTTAEATYTVKQNGDFTNYWLNAILPAPSNAAERAQRAAEAQPLLAQAAGLDGVSGLPVASQGLSEKDVQIHRQTAAKVAAMIHAASPSSADDLWHNIQTLAHYFDTGEVPGTSGYADEDDGIPF